MKRSAIDWILPLLLATVVLVLYGRTLNFEFLKLDDQIYIQNVPWVRQGLSLNGILQAFSHPVGNVYVPLVLISFMVDAGLYGLWPGGFHLTNVLFHMVNVLLFFIVFKRFSGKTWPSALAAMLFAVHPLHVESVAWIAERKDVLCAFFYLLTLGAYERWVRASSRGAYLAGLAFFVLALLSKPMAVSLPFGLFILDYWPLGRMNDPEHSEKIQLRRVFLLIWEKIPFVILAGLFSVMAMAATSDQVTKIEWSLLPLSARLQNAVISYAAYLEKLVVPMNLAVLYPHPGTAIPMGEVMVSALILAGIIGLAIGFRRRAPWVLAGVAWYLIALLPVIGLVQVGPQAMADRFVYIPFWGIYWVIGWSVMVVVDKGLVGRKILWAAGSILFLLLMAISWHQIGFWRNNLTLFTHAARVTSNNWRMENNVAGILIKNGELDGALSHLALAYKANPNEAMTHYNLGVLYMKQGKDRLALYHLGRVVELDPSYPRSHFVFGAMLAKTKQWDRALTQFEIALKQDGPSLDLDLALGQLYAVLGKKDLAAMSFRDALERDPENRTALEGIKKLETGVKNE